jgi:CO/xanthine dehydrogenase FAD-binding subunit
LQGTKLERKALADVARVVSEELDPSSDIHASADYRREVAGVLTRRALEAALAKATEQRRS